MTTKQTALDEANRRLQAQKLQVAWTKTLAQLQQMGASIAKREAEHRLGTLSQVNGLRMMEQGNFPHALLWLTEALRWDQADAERTQVQQQRLTALYRHSPDRRREHPREHLGFRGPSPTLRRACRKGEKGRKG